MRITKLNYNLFVSVILLISNIPSVLATPYLVYDPKNWIQTAATATSTAQTATNTATQLVNEAQSLKYQVQQLQTLFDTSSFDSADKNLSTQLNQLNSVLSSVQGIGYQLNDINNQFEKLFPSDAAWPSKSMDDYNSYLQQWSNEVQNASSTAMQTQSVVENIQYNNQQAQEILSQAKSDTNGEVSELQSVNQMLSVMQNQLGDLTSMLSTSSRLIATASAEAQSEQDEERQIMQSFTDSPTLSTTSGHSYNVNDF